jgi:NAD(P)-dependent dehydrogenase (short-subunit alcohol dehydrogenase family)/acyl carrier protein
VRPEHLGTLQTLGQIVDFLAAGNRPQTSGEPAAAAAGPLDRETVARTLLAVIAEKTGYPVEMLELDMALDADLGIDSIKRVEILSALQEQLPGAPAIRPEHLGTLQTVRQIVDFLASVSGAAALSTPLVPSADVPPVAVGIERKVLKVVPLPGRGERPRLDLAAGATVWIGDDGSRLAADLGAALAARHCQPVLVDLSRLDTLPPTPRLAGLVLLTPAQGADDAFLQQAFGLLQLAGPGLRAAAAAGTALLASVSRLGGSFGLLPGDELLDPISGGLAGLVKTAALEWPQVHCKAVDLSADLGDALAEELAGELLADGPVEVGLSKRGLHTLKLVDAPLGDEGAKPPLAEGDLVVISGGARGVTAEVAIALAGACRSTLLLLGRTPAPVAEAGWLQGLSGEGEIKKALVAQAAAPLKPREVEERYRRILADREIRSTLKRIEEAGGTPLYRAVDLRDATAVTAVLQEVRSSHGPVRGVIHGAGVLADRRIEDKTVAQFAEVYATKISGLHALLAAVGNDQLKVIALFSSSTGRYGRIGQIDYAVANEVLNKLAQQQARLRPACRVLSLNWGPWDGGMVTPALKKIFASEGVEIIDLAAGADYLLRELATAPGGPVELVIHGARVEAHSDTQHQPAANICISKAFDLELSVEQYPFLRSHVIDKKAVLPMAMIVEWMGHGAIHNNPGLRFHGFNDLRILKGVTLLEEHRHTLQVMTGKAFKSGDFHVVPVELSGMSEGGQLFVHARAKIVLATRLPDAKIPVGLAELPPYPDGEKIYRPERLFHGPDFHGIRQMLGCAKEGIAARVQPAPLPEKWIQQPLRNSWLADPLALDSSFQLMILWSFERYQAASLPVFAGRYRQYRESFPAAGSEIRIRITRQQASKATADIDFVDAASGQLIARIEDYECVIDPSLNQSFQRNKLQGAA